MHTYQNIRKHNLKHLILKVGLVVQALIFTTLSYGDTQLSTNHFTEYQPEVGYYQFKLGTYEITVISDGTVPQDLHTLLKGASQQKIDALLNQSHLTNPVEASINVFLVNTGDRLILIDTGAGDFFGKGFGGKFLNRLNKIGVDPEKITDILITHIHTDHTGGLVSSGKPVFPNANIYVGKADLDFFLEPNNRNGVNGYDKMYFQQAQMAMQPYVALGHVKPLSGIQKLLDNFTAYPTPGHTPGHYYYQLNNEGNSITFIGDSVHVESVQFPNPEITITYDVDQQNASKQRVTQFEKLSKQRSLVAAPHLPFPGVGYIDQEKNGFRFIRAEFHDREISLH